MLKEETESLKGDDQLEGFAVDIIRELSQLLEFNYTFIVEEDAEYGKELPDGSWVCACVFQIPVNHLDS